MRSRLRGCFFFFEVEVERKKNGESAYGVEEISTNDLKTPISPPLLTHPVHGELPGGLIHEHQDLQEKVVRQIRKGKAGGSGSGEDYFARVEA